MIVGAAQRVRGVEIPNRCTGLRHRHDRRLLLRHQRTEARERAEQSYRRANRDRATEYAPLRASVARYVRGETLGPLGPSVTRPTFSVLSHDAAAFRSSAAYAAAVTAHRNGPYPAR